MNLKIKFVFLIFLYIFTTGTSKSCYWNSECVYKYFSSKTPYNSVRGDIRDSIVKLKGCEPVSVWALIRHGKRSPGIDYGRNMLEALVIRDYVVTSFSNGKSSMCSQDVENLRDWEVDTELFENTHGLTAEGYKEMKEIGKRIKEAFKELLTNLEDGSYTLRSAYGAWIENGVDGFVKGISSIPLMVEKSNPKYDIMAPYEACPKYLAGVKHNPGTYKEADMYQSTPEFKAIKERIKNLTGVQYPLTDMNVTSLYDLCRYTWSPINNNRSPWCALFTNEDLYALEYYGDLRHYYRNGYGTPMPKKFGQIPMADLYKTFVNAKAGNHRKLTTYFSHATMMDMVYNALEWFKDEIPLRSVYRDPNRKWRSTMTSPFAGNLIAVLTRCIIDNREDYKVVFYTNEQPATWMCDNGVCSWHEFENKFMAYLNTTIDFCFT